jgi:hypothetical protein
VEPAYEARPAVSSAQRLEIAKRIRGAAGAILLTEPEELT